MDNLRWDDGYHGQPDDGFPGPDRDAWNLEPGPHDVDWILEQPNNKENPSEPALNIHLLRESYIQKYFVKLTKILK